MVMYLAERLDVPRLLDLQLPEGNPFRSGLQITKRRFAEIRIRNLRSFLPLLTNKILFKMFNTGKSIFLCPFAVYYLSYGARPLFTISRISLADGKRAG